MAPEIGGRVARRQDDRQRRRIVVRTVAAGVGVIVPASRLAKWKTVGQYVAITMLIFEKSVGSPGFHMVATGVLWVALALTIVSAADYFYRFFRKADYRAIVPDEERWS